MLRKKYTIEASASTLARFVAIIAKNQNMAFIQRVVPNAHDEYYYVTVIAEHEVHDELRDSRFTTAQTLPHE